MIPGQIIAWAAAGESETSELKRSSGRRREAARTVFAMINHRQFYGDAFDLLPEAERFMRENLPVAGERSRWLS